MTERKDKTIFLEVTIKRYYGFEEGQINGWSTERVIEEWFKDFDINEGHVSRDAFHYGNADVVKSIKEVTNKELEAEVISYREEIKARKKKMQEDFDSKWRGYLTQTKNRR